MHPKLSYIVNAMDVISQFYLCDSMWGVMDREKFIFYKGGEKVRAAKDLLGAAVPKGGAAAVAIETGERIIKTITDESIYGIKIKSISVPVFDDSSREVVGCVSIAISIEREDVVMGAAKALSYISDEMKSVTEEMASSAMAVASAFSDVKESSENVIYSIKKSDEILRLVNNIVSNTKLLGLNAAIEAARAGEEGRGFTVVATEIRKMANNSAASMEQIKSILDEIQTETEKIFRRIENSGDSAERQAAMAEEITSSMHELAEKADELNKLATLL